MLKPLYQKTCSSEILYNAPEIKDDHKSIIDFCMTDNKKSYELRFKNINVKNIQRIYDPDWILQEISNELH